MVLGRESGAEFLGGPPGPEGGRSAVLVVRLGCLVNGFEEAVGLYDLALEVPASPAIPLKPHKITLRNHPTKSPYEITPPTLRLDIHRTGRQVPCWNSPSLPCWRRWSVIPSSDNGGESSRGSAGPGLVTVRLVAQRTLSGLISGNRQIWSGRVQRSTMFS